MFTRDVVSSQPGSDHAAFVLDAMRFFPGGTIEDDLSGAIFEGFRDLARKHYPDLDSFARMEHAFLVLAESIGMLELAAARARHVEAVMRRMYADAKADLDEDIAL